MYGENMEEGSKLVTRKGRQGRESYYVGEERICMGKIREGK